MSGSSTKRLRKQPGKRPGELGFSLLLVVFSVTAFWQSYEISGFSGLSTPGVFPMLASATMLFAASCILLQCFRQPADSTHTALLEADSQTDILTVRLVIMVLLITGYLVAMPLIGFILASAAFLFLSFSYLWRKSLVVSLLITAVSVAAVYFIFRKLFQVVLPSGSLLQGLG